MSGNRSYWCSWCSEHIVVPGDWDPPARCPECSNPDWSSVPPIYPFAVQSQALMDRDPLMGIVMSGATQMTQNTPKPRRRPIRGRMRSQAHLRVIQGGDVANA
jgi:hypothetical protein